MNCSNNYNQLYLLYSDIFCFLIVYKHVTFRRRIQWNINGIYNQRTNNRWMRPNAASNVINSERTSLRSKIAMESGPFILDHEKKMLIVHSYGSYVKLPGKTNSERTIVMSCDVLIQSRSTCNLGVPPNQSPGKQVLFPWHPKRSVHPKAS